MEKIYHDKLILRGSPLTGENPQPLFRGPDLAVAEGLGFPADKRYSFGRETGFRILPYTMQDRYDRELRDMEFPSVVMENAFLRAEFIPALGGRLWSLYDKQRKRNILYRNPVFRPANLAIRDAWFSGGIEWNIGRLGHSVFTCSPVFAGIVKAQDPVLRIWEFERQTRLFWRVEFTLPENSPLLYAYTRIENPDTFGKPLYWWTNTAVPQTPGVRVFSAADEVIYIVPDTGAVKTMAGGRLPDLPVLPGKDASYPALSDYSNEYFFQNDRACGSLREPDSRKLPWESAVYEDGYAFGEISTAPLLYRKMFCWGSGRGGRRWQDFLTLPEIKPLTPAGPLLGETYLEVQAGLAPTQLHTADIAAGETLDWVQAFAALNMDPEEAHQKDYGAARAYVEDKLMRQIKPSALEAALEAARSRSAMEAEITSMGSGWGALEKAVPPGLCFPAVSISEAEAPWAELLRGGALPPRPPSAGPGSFAVDPAWEKLLEASPKTEGDWLSPYHLGVMAFEQGDTLKAAACWETSLKQQENPWALRNLARAALAGTDGKTGMEKALEYYRRALKLEAPPSPAGSAEQANGWDTSFLEEYVPLLIKAGKEEEAAVILAPYTVPGILETLPLPLVDAAAVLALNRGDDALLDRIFSLEPAHIREGNTTLVDLWQKRENRRSSKEEPPREIDFRMYTPC
ncbi:hypothetical protein AGMMS50230_05910 [Spirochaetia bacterium]|nr:hypothetical protein AGMMS50230_05910 [Spirochaetia bacterium]